MATVKENLIAAKALIDTPEKWGKGVISFPYSHARTPTCLCAHGAVRVHLGDGNWFYDDVCDPIIEALRRALPAGFVSTPDFNDHEDTTHPDIMALFDRAIASEEAKESAE